MIVKDTPTKIEQETQQCRPWAGAVSVGGKYQKLLKMAKKCRYLDAYGT